MSDAELGALLDAASARHYFVMYERVLDECAEQGPAGTGLGAWCAKGWAVCSGQDGGPAHARRKVKVWVGHCGIRRGRVISLYDSPSKAEATANRYRSRGRQARVHWFDVGDTFIKDDPTPWSQILERASVRYAERAIEQEKIERQPAKPARARRARRSP